VFLSLVCEPPKEPTIDPLVTEGTVLLTDRIRVILVLKLHPSNYHIVDMPCLHICDYDICGVMQELLVRPLLQPLAN
jgi:hypothetical protein